MPPFSGKKWAAPIFSPIGGTTVAGNALSSKALSTFFLMSSIFSSIYHKCFYCCRSWWRLGQSFSLSNISYKQQMPLPPWRNVAMHVKVLCATGSETDSDQDSISPGVSFYSDWVHSSWCQVYFHLYITSVFTVVGRGDGSDNHFPSPIFHITNRCPSPPEEMSLCTWRSYVQLVPKRTRIRIAFHLVSRSIQTEYILLDVKYIFIYISQVFLLL